MTTKTLDQIEAETQRFLQRLADVRRIEQENEEKKESAGSRYVYTQTGTRKHGALRRAAHDLKEILTFITQNKDIEDGK